MILECDVRVECDECGGDEVVGLNAGVSGFTAGELKRGLAECGWVLTTGPGGTRMLCDDCKDQQEDEEEPGADLDQATWTLARQLTARFDPPPAPAAAEKPEKPKRTRKPKAASQDPAAPPVRAEIPTPDLDNALRAILRWDLIDPCTDDEILAALEREWATPVEGRHPPGPDPTRGAMWSARVHPTLRRAEFRYGCGPDESATPTLTGPALVAAVRRAFAVPKPEEATTPPAGPGCPELSGIVRVNAVSAAPEPEAVIPPARAKLARAADAHRSLSEILSTSPAWSSDGPTWHNVVTGWRATGATDSDVLAGVRAAFGLSGDSRTESATTRGVRWSARSTAAGGLEWRYFGCGPGEPPTQAGGDLVETVRLLFAIPTPEEVTRGEDRPGEPVRVPELPAVDAHDQPEQRDDAVRGDVPGVQEAGKLLVDVPDEPVPGDGNARLLPPDPGGVRPARRQRAGVRAGRGDAVLPAGGGPAPAGAGAAVREPPDAGGIHGAGVRPEVEAVALPARVDDFDEATPPPRRRPQGEPVTGFVTLGPAESLVGTFWNWDQQGRIPLGSLLAEGVRELGQFRGWKLAAPPYTHKPDGLPAAGEMLPAGLAAGYEPRAVVQVKGEKGRYTVLSPKAAT